MEELPRVSALDDPYLALRTALTVMICLLLAEPLGITMPMLPVVMAMSIMSNQRGALNPRTFATPIVLPIVGIVFSWIAAVTVNEPMVFTIVNIILAVGGLALMVMRGSRGGMMLTVFPLMMAMSAIMSDYVLVVMRDSMVMGGLALGIAVVGLNLLFPPTTKTVHVEMVAPLASTQAGKHLLIRSIIYVPAMIWLFSTGDMTMMTIVIMMLFVCGEPRRGTQMNQVIDRGGGTVVGAGIAAGVLMIYSMIPEMPVLVLLCTIITYYLVDKMTTGKQRPLIYQYTCSAALVMILQSTTGGVDALEAVLQRIVMTGGAMLAAILILALLEALLLDPDEELPSELRPA
ncbi:MULTISPECIES: FUSC family protein [unclassified Devosia]|uniref:FUSC family protein n=1 Tax=unclassified Devosia TaxID=196773 RepID=UPI00145F8033|nr:MULTISPECIES: FUSC family protein [unclassified Devosia]MBJ6988327.1 FUSC family protein [Devosia sp. MC521]MBJ7579055.1 FUSC family protein [Devosia sp. MC532]QMW63056.1 FUSC family protein [Devosia sp. MC521]